MKEFKVCSKCGIEKSATEYTVRRVKIKRKGGSVYEIDKLLSMCKCCKRKES